MGIVFPAFCLLGVYWLYCLLGSYVLFCVVFYVLVCFNCVVLDADFSLGRLRLILGLVRSAGLLFIWVEGCYTFILYSCFRFSWCGLWIFSGGFSFWLIASVLWAGVLRFLDTFMSMAYVICLCGFSG